MLTLGLSPSPGLFAGHFLGPWSCPSPSPLPGPTSADCRTTPGLMGWQACNSLLGPTSALSCAVPLGRSLGLSVSQFPICPRGSLVPVTPELLAGLARFKRPETPCKEQVSFLVQFLICSSVEGGREGRTFRVFASM